jgi:sulfur-carrier protein
MKIELRYFASIREALGPGETLEFAADAPTLGAEVLARGRALRAAIDQRMAVDDAAPVSDGAEVAFFPPVTGG